MPKPYTPNDKWSQRAAEAGYRARSVFKLQQLDERFHFFKTGMKVLDIGAAPGSWLQYASEHVGPSGKILGLDLKEIAPVADNVVTQVCDILDDAALAAAISSMGWDKVDIVISDIAPNTSGIKDVDQWKSIELSRRVLDISRTWLRGRGWIVMKIFRGRDFDTFLQEVKEEFNDVKPLSVEASRDRSMEVYVVCRKR